MIEIKAGPELDRAIAKIVGVPMPPWASDPYSPSTDLNHAFAAAEKVGLFKEYAIGKRLDGYNIFLNADYHMEGDEIAFHARPAVAVCAAILSVEGRREERKKC